MCYSKFKQLKRYEKPIVTEYTLSSAVRLLAGSEASGVWPPQDPVIIDLP